MVVIVIQIAIDWSIHQSSTPWQACHMFPFQIYLELSDPRIMLLVIRSLVTFSRASSFSADISAYFHTHACMAANSGVYLLCMVTYIHNKFYPFNRYSVCLSAAIHAPQLKGADELQTITSHLLSKDVN